MLLKEGADINAVDNDNTTPIMTAVYHGNQSVAMNLMNQNANLSITEVDSDGLSILHYAVSLLLIAC